MDIFFFPFLDFGVLLFMFVWLWFRPKSGMKNCNLLNRIVPRACQSPRNFTNASAESLGTKLLYGHASTIGKPVIARRNNHGLCAVAQPNESFFHNQPRPQRGKSFCKLLCLGSKMEDSD